MTVFKTLRPLAFAALLLALGATAQSSAAAAPKAGNPSRVGIAAIVNDDVITFSDLENRTRLYAAGRAIPTGDALKAIENDVLNRLIDEKLQLGEAKTLSIEVADQQVQEAFNQVANQNGMDPDSFRQKLRSSGVRTESLYDQLRAEIAWSQVVRRKLRPQVNVSESEIDSELEQAARAPQSRTEYQVAEILLPADAGIKAEDIIKKLLGGARFSEVARAESKAATAEAGGDRGWVSEGQIDPALSKALQQMQPGQVSPPIKTAAGLNILFLRDVRGTGPGVESASADAQSSAPAAAEATPLKMHLKRLTIPVGASDPAAIVNAKIARAQSLAAEVKDCAAMDAKTAEFANASGDLGTVEATQLPEAVQAAVINLPVNSLSAPVRAPEGITVFMVCDKSGGEPVAAAASQEVPLPKFVAPKGDEAAREKVANKLGSERLAQMQERYLRDLRATAFIERRL